MRIILDSTSISTLHAQSRFKVKCIYSSDLLRAMQTAQPIADKLNVPIIPLPEFREVNNGILAGMRNELANKMYPGLYWNTLDWQQKYPGGESPCEFYDRISKGWEWFSRKVLRRNENVLLVSHGGVMNVILAIVTGERYSNKTQQRKIRNTELLALEYQGGKWREIDPL